MFFALEPEKFWIGDLNKRLINTYLAVRDFPQDVINQVNFSLKNHCKETYYLTRLWANENFDDDDMLAGWFIYLNKTCFNGLYRENQKGEFNVPIGSYKTLPTLDEDNLKKCSEALQRKGYCYSGPYTMIEPDQLDFVYLDPPYHKTFTNYTSSGFGEDSQRELAEWYKKYSSTAFLMQSNSDTPLIRELYKDFRIEEVEASRSMSSDSTRRGKETELLIRNY